MTIEAEILSDVGRFLNTGKKDDKKALCETGVSYHVNLDIPRTAIVNGSEEFRVGIDLQDFGTDDKGGKVQLHTLNLNAFESPEIISEGIMVALRNTPSKIEFEVPQNGSVTTKINTKFIKEVQLRFSHI